MNYTKPVITTTLLFKTLFLLVFWGMWLILPFLMFSERNGMEWVLYKVFPINASLIFLFFFNTEVLIGKLLVKKGIAYYVLSLLTFILIFFAFHVFIKNMVGIGADKLEKEIMRTFFPILTVTAVSTGYGLVSYLIKQQKLNEEENQQRKQSELAFLRSQISPHFIFNALNSIVYLIRTKSPNAEDVTIKLSEIMQHMLYNSRDKMVMLDKELNYLENYIELQKIRFGEDVVIEYTLNGDTNMKLIEPMLIIPFVENAFKHGTGAVLKPFIDVKINIDGFDFTMLVRNKFNPGEDNVSGNSGIGLENVRRRLEILYPETHSLEITTNEDWYQTTLKLKLHQ